jgi:hypothetical protein
VNKQTIVLIAVAVVAAIAAILILLPTEGPVTVPKSTAQGTATVSSDAPEFQVDEARSTSPEHRGTITSRLTYEPHPVANPRSITEGIVPQPGIPLDRHGQHDSHIWIGIYRMLLKDGGRSDLAERVHDMGTTVAGVTAANEVASYAPLFAEERKLMAEVRGATTNAQILENCDQLEAAIAAIESGHLHPMDKEFEPTAAAEGNAASPGAQ